MNSQQYVVFLKHLLETDSSGVRGTETITPWNSTGSLVVGWAPSSQEWQKRLCYSYCTAILSFSIANPCPQPSTQVISPWSGSAKRLLCSNNWEQHPLTPALGSPDTWVKRRGVRGWGSSSLVRICVWVQSEKREPNGKILKSFTKYTGLLGAWKYSFCRADTAVIALVFSCFTEK